MTLLSSATCQLACVCAWQEQEQEAEVRAQAVLLSARVLELGSISTCCDIPCSLQPVSVCLWPWQEQQEEGHEQAMLLAARVQELGERLDAADAGAGQVARATTQLQVRSLHDIRRRICGWHGCAPGRPPNGSHGCD